MRSATLDDKAIAHFLEGYNCAQSVLPTMLEDWGVKSELVPKIATGFGSGIGRCGSLCGAVAGGVMALGVRFGTSEPSADKRKRIYRLTRSFLKQFEREHGSLLCRQLLGYDLSEPDQLKRAKKANVFDEKCTVYVGKAVQTIVRLCRQAS